MRLTRLFLPMGLPILTHAQEPSPATVFMPLNYRYGANHKVSTDLKLPWSNTSIEVVYDLGSDNFWVFGPNSTNNWGSSGLHTQGRCNRTVNPFYDYTSSPTASKAVPTSAYFEYGASTKIILGNLVENDTFIFANDAKQTSSVPNVRVVVANYVQHRYKDDDTCSRNFSIDLSIMGMAPFVQSKKYNTRGPSFRQDLLDRGAVSNAVHSMWFDEPPAEYDGTFTGGGLIGGIDTSKYTGRLLRIPLIANTVTDPHGDIGYWVDKPAVSVNGKIFNATDYYMPYCMLDSGTQIDELPIRLEEEMAFAEAAGLIRMDGRLGWPGSCSDIPLNRTVDFIFHSWHSADTVTVKVPIRNYVRNNDAEEGKCVLNMVVSGCMLAAPFSTSAFFAADDDEHLLWLAQGGVSKRGSGPDPTKLVATISER